MAVDVCWGCGSVLDSAPAAGQPVVCNVCLGRLSASERLILAELRLNRAATDRMADAVLQLLQRMDGNAHEAGRFDPRLGGNQN
jgi:hypothetical protein